MFNAVSSSRSAVLHNGNTVAPIAVSLSTWLRLLRQRVEVRAYLRDNRLNVFQFVGGNVLREVEPPGAGFPPTEPHDKAFAFPIPSGEENRSNVVREELADFFRVRPIDVRLIALSAKALIHLLGPPLLERPSCTPRLSFPSNAVHS
jgi:hypothetical protein